MSNATQFDHYLGDDGPAALVIREWLAPVEGADGGVLFPPTFAAGDNFPGGYNIDGDPAGQNVCLVDSVGSQANRIEPIFKDDKYKHLIPQVVVKAGEKDVHIVEAGHRAGDALVRCSSLQADLQKAFKAVLQGDAEPLARLAPTSLVFGVWDSRDTQAKLPRVVASTVRAFNVRKLTRSAQFNPATEYVNDKLLDEPADKATKDAYAERGFIHVPASGSHGGVIAAGGVRRDATLGLAALRLLRAADADKTLALRRYVLGLSLTALTATPNCYYRQGCMLVLDTTEGRGRAFTEVYPNGDRNPLTLSHDDALAYATAAAAAFGVDPGKTVPFEKDRAVRDVRGEGAEATGVQGMIIEVKAAQKTFKVKQGTKKVNVTTNDATVYFKGEAASTFEEVVKKDTSVTVELADGVAVKVTGN